MVNKLNNSYRHGKMWSAFLLWYAAIRSGDKVIYFSPKAVVVPMYMWVELNKKKDKDFKLIIEEYIDEDQ